MCAPTELTKLKDITLAPYILKATALIGRPRKVGGNMFRHQMATMSILIDYKYEDSILLKAAVVHDLLEDLPLGGTHGLESVDDDGPKVLELVKELTLTYSSDKLSDEERTKEKEDQISKIMTSGSNRAKLIKLADRISNITDISSDIQEIAWIEKYIKQTEDCILKFAESIQKDMHKELKHAIQKKKIFLTIQHPLKKTVGAFRNAIKRNGNKNKKKK
jgi:GTP pyrophosphokinase